MKIALPLALLAATASANNDGHKHVAAAETLRKAFLHRIQLNSNTQVVTREIFTDNRDIRVKFTCVDINAYPNFVANTLNTQGLLTMLPNVMANATQAVALIHVTLNNPANYAVLANFGLMTGVAPNNVPREVLVSHSENGGTGIGENFGTSLYRLDGTRYISFQPYSGWTHVLRNTNVCHFGARIEYTRRKGKDYAAADAEQQVEEEGDDDYSDELEAISDDK